MVDIRETPEFLIWAMEYSCPIRGFQDGSDPERTERQLRAAREVSEARLEGRIFEGICVKPPDGFRASEALAIYGGLAAVEAACEKCPANVLAQRGPSFLAGCYGILALPREGEPFHRAVDAAAREHAIGREITAPAWYGLWVSSPPDAERAANIAAILETAAASLEGTIQGFADLAVALRHAHIARNPIHVAMYARGRVESSQWIISPHCARCKVTWPSEALRRCETCGYESPAAPCRKRKARGTRPYFPLSRLLGTKQAAELLLRYKASRSRPESRDRPQSLPPQEPRDNPPGD